MQSDKKPQGISAIWLVLVGSTAFFITLISLFPITIIAPYLKQYTPLHFKSVSGTLWQGQMRRTLVGNTRQAFLGDINWKIRKNHLLMGKLSITFETKQKKRFSKGEVRLLLNKTVELYDTHFQTNADYLHLLTPEAKFLTGNIVANIEYLRWSDKTAPPSMTGTLVWQGGLKAPVLEDGYYQVDISDNGEHPIMGIISTKNAPFDISGKIFIQKEWIYSAELHVSANERTNTHYFELLSNSKHTQKDSNGNILFQFSGTPLYRKKSRQ